jgi:hypothetical protein
MYTPQTCRDECSTPLWQNSPTNRALIYQIILIFGIVSATYNAPTDRSTPCRLRHDIADTKRADTKSWCATAVARLSFFSWRAHWPGSVYIRLTQTLPQWQRMVKDAFHIHRFETICYAPFLKVLGNSEEPRLPQHIRVMRVRNLCWVLLNVSVIVIRTPCSFMACFIKQINTDSISVNVALLVFFVLAGYVLWNFPASLLRVPKCI